MLLVKHSIVIILCTNLMFAAPPNWHDKLPMRTVKNHMPTDDQMSPLQRSLSSKSSLPALNRDHSMNVKKNVDGFPTEDASNKTSTETALTSPVETGTTPKISHSLKTDSQLPHMDHAKFLLHFDSIRQSWAKFQNIWEKVANKTDLDDEDRLHFLQSFRHNTYLTTLAWPVVLTTIVTVMLLFAACTCCFLRRPVYCCGQLLCDLSRDNTNNHMREQHLNNSSQGPPIIRNIELQQLQNNTNEENTRQHQRQRPRRNTSIRQDETPFSPRPLRHSTAVASTTSLIQLGSQSENPYGPTTTSTATPAE